MAHGEIIKFVEEFKKVDKVPVKEGIIFVCNVKQFEMMGNCGKA